MAELTTNQVLAQLPKNNIHLVKVTLSFTLDTCVPDNETKKLFNKLDETNLLCIKKYRETASGNIDWHFLKYLRHEETYKAFYFDGNDSFKYENDKFTTLSSSVKSSTIHLWIFYIDN